jgi:hypothetical protein
MSAFSDFTQIWKSDQNIFKYLLDAKDSAGTPLYQPQPAVPRMPLITVNRRTWRYDSQRSFSLHMNRFVGWPTTTSANKSENDIGYSYEAYMPSAWNYSVQIDHYAMRPDGQAYFINQLQQCFFPSASVPQFWTPAVYPGVYGLKNIRVFLEGDITDSTEEEPAEGYRVYRTTLNLVIQGWSYPTDLLPVSTFWTSNLNVLAVSPCELEKAYEEALVPDIEKSTDIRTTAALSEIVEEKCS